MGFNHGKNNLAITIVIFASSVVAHANETPYSPNVNQNNPTNVYFGDTHLHTSLSVDANVYGNERLSPDFAYKFARGESVIAANGMKVRLRRPLDFLAVADHANNMGLVPALNRRDPTPRWTAYDAKFFKIKNIPDEVPMVTQERAYTSPIWYTPSESHAFEK